MIPQPPVLALTVPGEPVPKGRPRAWIDTHYEGGREVQRVKLTPSPKSHKYEALVRSYATLAMAEAGIAVLREALAVRMVAVLPVPASYSRPKTEKCLAGIIAPAKRPDVDNLCKAALDACNGIIWHDDAMITDLHVVKRYGRTPRLEMGVERAALPLEMTAETEAA